MNDRTIIGSLVDLLGKRCRICECEGESCSLETGEKCVLANGLCSNPRCITAAYWQDKRARRARTAPVRSTRRGRVA